MNISRFYLDTTPVTRAQYSRYLQDSGYQPADTHNFLRNWTKTKVKLPGGAGGTQVESQAPLVYRHQEKWEYHYRPADAHKPVVHVSLTEARLYCAYYGKRLPHTWEWSYAAQGTDQRIYPWGTNGTSCEPNDTKCLAKSAVDGSHCPPLQQHTQGDQEGLANVTAYPQGASPFGVLDMVGNVSATQCIVSQTTHPYAQFCFAFGTVCHSLHFSGMAVYGRVSGLAYACGTDQRRLTLLPCRRSSCALVLSFRPEHATSQRPARQVHAHVRFL